MKKGQKVKPGSLKGGKNMPSSKAKLGSGGRFKALEGKLSKKGVKKPSALAAALGRAKVGNKKMAQLAAKGRKKK
ncbi:MAG: hypothetical protein R3230_01240 [Nitrosopumilaceae archaeon]|nr:hypothetical protein [Nitrosopumilaceae archaeon]